MRTALGIAHRCEDHSVITTFLVNHAAAVRVLFWVALIAFAALGWFVYRRGTRWLLATLTVVSVVGAVALTMTPDGTGGNGTFCTVQFSVPFRGIDTLANVALLFPVTLFAGLRTTRPVWAVAAASGFSAAVELLQALVPSLGRACDTDDWFMNTVGAVLAGLVALGIIAIDRRAPRGPEQSPRQSVP